MNQSKSPVTVRDIAIIGVLSGLSAVLFMLDFPIFPAVPFYKIDFSNVPALLGAFALGPWQGTLIVFIKALLGLLHSTTTGVGELADFLMGAAMVIPAGFLYRRVRQRKGAVLGMLLGTFVATICAALINLWLLIPFYSKLFGMPIEKIVSMGTKLFPAVGSLGSFVCLITVPFNLIKWILNSLIVFLIYKPLSPILHDQRRGGVKAE